MIIIIPYFLSRNLMLRSPRMTLRSPTCLANFYSQTERFYLAPRSYRAAWITFAPAAAFGCLTLLELQRESQCFT
jgi:hypothetical protein